MDNLPSLSWIKSSKSAADNCVEVAFIDDRVFVRDSKDPDGPRLSLTRAAWRTFLEGLPERPRVP